MPSLRQFVLLAAVWAATLWVGTVIWALVAQETPVGDALHTYYALRAPLVGAVSGVLWAPLLCTGWLPGRAASLAGRRAGLAVEHGTRMVSWGLQGVLVGHLLGATATVLLLFLWPADNPWSSIDSAVRWSMLFWKAYWYLFVPCCTVAGVTSVWVAVRFGPSTVPAEI